MRLGQDPKQRTLKYLIPKNHNIHMGLFEKVETDVEIRASSLKCKEIIHERPHHISDVSTDIIHGINLHEGEWGKVDSILYWKYLHDLSFI